MGKPSSVWSLRTSGEAGPGTQGRREEGVHLPGPAAVRLRRPALGGSPWGGRPRGLSGSACLFHQPLPAFSASAGTLRPCLRPLLSQQGHHPE